MGVTLRFYGLSVRRCGRHCLSLCAMQDINEACVCKQIFIITLENVSWCLQVEPSDTIDAVKQQIEVRTQPQNPQQFDATIVREQ